MRFKTVEKDCVLKMWEKTDMPESNPDKGSDGKTVYKKTGKMLEFTTYTFIDGFGEKLVLLSKDNSFRTLEGKKVNIEVEVVFNDFQKKNRVSLGKLEELK